MRLLLDTNVLVDYFAQREPFAEDVTRLRIAACFGDVELWASAQSFPDIEYILRGAIPVDELRQMMAQSMDFLEICSTSASDVREAFSSGWPDLEDYLIACAAQRVKADCLITRDGKGFAQSKVPAMPPKAFFEMLERERGIIYEEVDF